MKLKDRSFLAWFELGNTVVDPWWGASQYGWEYFFGVRFEPVISLPFCDGGYLHNPFTQGPGTIMAFDEMLLALAAGVFSKEDVSSFVNATRKFKQRHPDKFLGVYLGDVRTLMQRVPGPFDRLQAINDIVQTCRYADEICIDGAATYEASDPATCIGRAVVASFMALGLQIRIEASRGKTSLDAPVLAMEDIWRQGRETWAKGVPQPGVLRVLNGLLPTQTWVNRNDWMPGQAKDIYFDAAFPQCSIGIDAASLVESKDRYAALKHA